MRIGPLLPPTLALLVAAAGCSADTTATSEMGTPSGDLAGTPPPDLGAASIDLAPAINPKPTIAPWLGTNIAADLPRVDVTYQLAPFDTPMAKRDANGYPVAGASGTSRTDIGFILPTGNYTISYRGTGQLAVSGIGKLTGAWQAAAGEQRAVVAIIGSPGAFGNFLTLTIQNGANQTVTDLHILSPGFDYDTTTVFLPQFIRILQPFRALRFMDWESTNNSTIANWSDRPTAAAFGQSPNGQPWEHIVALINQTGKDAWLTIPEHATDDFVRALGQFLTANLDFGRIKAARDAAGFTTPFQILFEVANETWNGGFSAYGTLLAAAEANPMRYDGVYDGTYGPSWMSQNADLMRVGQYEADRLVQAATLLRAALGTVGKSDVISPVLSGWALGTAYSDVGLRFIKAHVGDPKASISHVAIAPYFGPDDSQTATLAALFASCEQNITSMDSTYKDFARLVADYGLTMAAYEGGQGISGTTNQPIKHLAQHDARMHQAYVDYLSLWNMDFGASLFMHFSLAGDPGLPEFIYQYGYWGSIIGVLEDPVACAASLPTLTGNEAIADVVHHCPKYAALAEQVPK